ncbi:hypothetical protein E4U55_004932 [Claviceps digitariae]|nr:hypothetical protein E4U55_004932 [Claviceps digitariae]
MQHHSKDPFPKPSAGFTAKKTKILDQLAVPEAEYTDASPKGTIDAGIRDLIDEINAVEGFVTTSSCAGRVSVFLEGIKVAEVGAGAGATDQGDGDGDGDGDDGDAEVATSRAQIARVGGKGAGGTWLFVSHDVVEGEEWAAKLAFGRGGVGGRGRGGDGEGGGWESADALGGRRLIHFKFEPMILHILTASPSHAQALLQAALQAGFRESGALNIAAQANSSATPMVAIRSMGLSFESLIGYEANGRRYQLVTGPYLQALMVIARERFAENAKRIARFRRGFSVMSMRQDGRHWEDGRARRERMREEGLRRREALAGAERGRHGKKAEVSEEDDDEEEEAVFSLDL